MSPFPLGEGLVGGVAGGSPLTGVVEQAVNSASSSALQGIASWVLGGTRGALEDVAGAIGASTEPNLNSTWFSSTYWRVAALAAMLTIPFLCAAAVQAVARGDIGLLVRAAFTHLPLAVIGVSLAAPLTMLMLAATDQMSAAVSAGASTGAAQFLDHTAAVAASLSGSVSGSAFFAVTVGLLALVGALALAVELLMRAAAVYVVVLMLPLAFAAFVWPARRVWATRMVELLVSLILSKFAIVAVLALAAAAFSQHTGGVGQLLVAMALLLLSTFAPWALMRILPFAELAAGTAGVLRDESVGASARAGGRLEELGAAGEHLAAIPARLRDHARALSAPKVPDDTASPQAEDAVVESSQEPSRQASAALRGGDIPAPAAPEPGVPGPAQPPAPEPPLTTFPRDHLGAVFVSEQTRIPPQPDEPGAGQGEHER
jgi:hypothetical protein